MENDNHAIKLDYKAGRDDLAGSLLVLSKMIEGQKRASDLLMNASGEDSSYSTYIEMQEIKSSSIILELYKRFRNRSGDEIQATTTNTFIDNAFITLIKFINTHDTLSKDKISDIRNKLIDDYIKSGGKNTVLISTISDNDIIECLKAIEVPKNILTQHQTIIAVMHGEEFILNQNFTVCNDQLELESLETTKEIKLRLKVKKPDYIGDSKWIVIYNEKPINAKFSDTNWLREFHNGKLPNENTPMPKDVMIVIADIIIVKKQGREESIELDIKKVICIEKHNTNVQREFDGL